MDASIRDTSGTYQPWVDKVEIEAKEDEQADGKAGEITFRETLKPMLIDGPVNIFLLGMPISLLCYWSDGPQEVTFVFSLLALAPLAERLSFATEQVAIHTNETIAGLLNVTFGNATELIVSISALIRGLYRLVQLSLLGSILSNMLLVLGCALFCGGVYHSEQRFGTISSQMNSTLLMLAVTAIICPTILTSTEKESKLGELGYSRGTSLLLFGLYCGFIYFQLYSHKHLYDAPVKQASPPVVQSTAYSAITGDSSHPEGASSGAENGNGAASNNGHLANVEEGTQTSGNANAEEDGYGGETYEEEDVLGFRHSVSWLLIITVATALVSDAICATIEEASENMGVSKVFTAAIVLPILGNACEHAGAVVFAIKGRLELTMGIAIGSSTQIALCVLPLLVLLGWMMGHSLSMNFGAFEAATLFLSVVAVTFAIKDGSSNWLLGMTLMFTYFVIALGFWAHSNDSLDERL